VPKTPKTPLWSPVTLLLTTLAVTVAGQQLAGLSAPLGFSAMEGSSIPGPYDGECFETGSGDFTTVYNTLESAQAYGANSGWTGNTETWYETQAAALTQIAQTMASNDSDMHNLIQQHASVVSQVQEGYGGIEDTLLVAIAAVFAIQERAKALMALGLVDPEAMISAGKLIEVAWKIAKPVSAGAVLAGMSLLSWCAGSAGDVAHQVGNIDYATMASQANAVYSALSAAMTSSATAASTPSSVSTSPASAATASPSAVLSAAASPAGTPAGGGVESPSAPDKTAVSTPAASAAYATPSVAAGAGQPGGITAPQAGSAPGQVSPAAMGFTMDDGAAALTAPSGGASTTAAPQQGKPARPAPTGDTPDAPDAPAAPQSANGSTDTLAAPGTAGAERAPIQSTTPAPAQTPIPTPAPATGS